MSGQMNLLAQPSEAKIEVPVCLVVLHHGSRAGRKKGTLEPLFPHRPAKVSSDEEWMIALDYAEETRRYEQSGRAVLELDSQSVRGPGGRSGPGEPRLWVDSRGVEINDTLIAWPPLLAGRTEQREIEPEVARARDLAQAYKYLDYFGEVYDKRPHREEWSPVPLIRRLAEEARALGGDPTLLPLHTEYMCEGIAEAE